MSWFWERLAFLRWLDPAARTVLVLLLTLGVIAAGYSWRSPLMQEAERAVHDLRVVLFAPRVDQDRRITLVVFTDDTLDRVGKRFPLDRKTLADALLTLDGMGAKAIGIDILFDQPEPDDPQLISVLRGMRTPVRLAHASNRTSPDQIFTWQEEALEDFLRRADGGSAAPMSIRLRTDPDGVTRRWPEPAATGPPLLPFAMAGPRPAFAGYTGAIDFTMPVSREYPAFAKLPIDFFTGDMAPVLRSQIEGRYVLIGADIRGLDDHQTPLSAGDRPATKGLELHANMLSQVLDGRVLFQIPGWLFWIAPVPLVAAGAATALLKGRPLALAAAGQLVLLAAAPFAIHAAAKVSFGVPAVGWLIGWLCGFAAVRVVQRTIRWEKGRVAETALSRYLPQDVATDILSSPDSLNLRGERKMIFALFTDMEKFTGLCHAMETGEVAKLLNQYLETLSQIVLDHGGTVDKFVGDALVAFWGAPIAKPDDGERANRAALALYAAGEAFRERASREHGRPVGRTRVGLHYGEAIIGNFGGRGRIQYTALGDTMNLAARLEAANKRLGTSVLVSRAAAEHAGDILYRPLGEIVVRGRSAPVEVVEPAGDMDAGEVGRMQALYERHRSGDTPALGELRAWAKQRPADKAFAKLVKRLAHDAHAAVPA